MLEIFCTAIAELLLESCLDLFKTERITAIGYEHFLEDVIEDLASALLMRLSLLLTTSLT